MRRHRAHCGVIVMVKMGMATMDKQKLIVGTVVQLSEYRKTHCFIHVEASILVANDNEK